MILLHFLAVYLQYLVPNLKLLLPECELPIIISVIFILFPGAIIQHAEAFLHCSWISPFCHMSVQLKITEKTKLLLISSLTWKSLLYRLLVINSSALIGYIFVFSTKCHSHKWSAVIHSTFATYFLDKILFLVSFTWRRLTTERYKWLDSTRVGVCGYTQCSVQCMHPNVMVPTLTEVFAWRWYDHHFIFKVLWSAVTQKMRRQDARENRDPTQDLRKAVTGSKIVMCRETRGGAKGTLRREKTPTSPP